MFNLRGCIHSYNLSVPKTADFPAAMTEWWGRFHGPHHKCAKLAKKYPTFLVPLFVSNCQPKSIETFFLHKGWNIPTHVWNVENSHPMSNSNIFIHFQIWCHSLHSLCVFFSISKQNRPPKLHPQKNHPPKLHLVSIQNIKGHLQPREKRSTPPCEGRGRAFP